MSITETGVDFGGPAILDEDDGANLPTESAHRKLERMAKVSSIAEQVPTRHRASYLRAMNGTGSPRQAIKAKCYECTGYEDSTDRISNCTCHRCPLWAFRPFQKGDAA